MATLVIQHPVANFEAWKQAFDSDPIGRRQNGVTRHTVYRPADNPNYVVIDLEFSTREQAQALLGLLHDLWGGVGGELGFGGPEGVETRILDEVERVDY